MKYKVGDKVMIVTKPIGGDWNDEGKMDKWLGKVMTIRDIEEDGAIKMEEDIDANSGQGWFWSKKMIRGIVK